jgi:hypothetical protein
MVVRPRSIEPACPWPVTTSATAAPISRCGVHPTALGTSVAGATSRTASPGTCQCRRITPVMAAPRLPCSCRPSAQVSCARAAAVVWGGAGDVPVPGNYIGGRWGRDRRVPAPPPARGMSAAQTPLPGAATATSPPWRTTSATATPTWRCSGPPPEPGATSHGVAGAGGAAAGRAGAATSVGSCAGTAISVSRSPGPGSSPSSSMRKRRACAYASRASPCRTVG